MTQLINDKAVYRTAPATPGLLNMTKTTLPILARGIHLKPQNHITTACSANNGKH